MEQLHLFILMTADSFHFALTVIKVKGYKKVLWHIRRNSKACGKREFLLKYHQW